MLRFQKQLLFGTLCYLTFLMLFFPTVSMSAAREAMDLCQNTVMPSLFPFFVLSHLLICLGFADRLGRFLSPVMGPLFGISGSGAVAVVLGLISGYPVGASCAASLYQRGSCTKAEAERLLAFCNNAGPMFVMGAVGIGMLHSREAGALLYGVHLFSALLTGLFLKKKVSPSVHFALPPATLSSPWSAVGESVFHGVTSIAKVCGFVIFFSVLTAPLSHTPWGYAVYPFLEITGGIAAMVPQVPPALCLPLVSFFLAFSGVSVFLQVAAISLPCGLSLKPFFLGKCLQAVLSFTLTFFFQSLLPLSVTAAKTSFASFLSAASFFSFAGKGFLLWSLPLFFSLLWTLKNKKNPD